MKARASCCARSASPWCRTGWAATCTTPRSRWSTRKGGWCEYSTPATRRPWHKPCATTSNDDRPLATPGSEYGRRAVRSPAAATGTGVAGRPHELADAGADTAVDRHRLPAGRRVAAATRCRHRALEPPRHHQPGAGHPGRHALDAATLARCGGQRTMDGVREVHQRALADRAAAGPGLAAHGLRGAWRVPARTDRHVLPAGLVVPGFAGAP